MFLYDKATKSFDEERQSRGGGIGGLGGDLWASRDRRHRVLALRYGYLGTKRVPTRRRSLTAGWCMPQLGMAEEANKQDQNLQPEYGPLYCISWSMSCAFQLTPCNDQFFILPQLSYCILLWTPVARKCQSSYICDLMFKGNFHFLQAP